MLLAKLRERFVHLSELVQDDLRPVILGIATDLLYEFEHHRLKVEEIRSSVNHLSSRMAVAIASAIDDLWANESLELKKREHHIRIELQQLRDSVEHIERHVTDLEQRIDQQYHVIMKTIAILRSSNTQKDTSHG